MQETIRLLNGLWAGRDIIICGPDARYVGLRYVIDPFDMPEYMECGLLYIITHPKTAYKPWGATVSAWRFDRTLR